MAFQLDTQLHEFVIGRRVQEIRRRLRIPQEVLCRGLISQSALSQIENGKYPLERSTLRELGRRLDDPWLREQSHTLGSPRNEVEEPILLDLILTYRGSMFPALMQAAIKLAKHYFEREELEMVDKLADKIIHDKGERNDVFYYTACYYKGRVLSRQFRYYQAFDHLKIAVRGDHKLEPLIQAESWYYLGYASFFLERIEVAHDACNKCIHLCEEHHFFKLWAMSYGLQGTIFRKAGQYENALIALRRSYEMMVQVGGTEDDKFRMQLSIGDNLELLGCYNEAEVILSSACEKYHGDLNTTHLVSKSSAYRILARLKDQKGMRSESLNYLKRSIECAEEAGDGWSMSWSYLLAIGLFHDEEEKIAWAERARSVSFQHQQQLQAALANECLIVLGNKNADELAIESIMIYRDLVLNGNPEQFPTLRLLPICHIDTYQAARGRTR